MRRHNLIGIVGLLVFLGCNQKPTHSPVAPQAPPGQAKALPTRDDKQVDDVPLTITERGAAALTPSETLGVNALQEVQEMNSPAHPLPAADFAPGESSPKDFDASSITTTERGFTIQMPSETPVPTPTVYRGRLYASGGFSSKEFYCFDALTGAFIWGAQLSDDGPSVAVPSDDDIIFNTESCTIFALDAATGKLHWAHYMGDPMMGAPTVAGDRVVTVYPAQQRAEVEDNTGTDESQAASAVSAEPVGKLQPTYNLACLDAKTGELQWRRWLDGDCISAPVAVDDELFVATLPGTLYRLRTADGTFLRAHHARATSAPVVTSTQLFFTRRTDDPQQTQSPTEALVAIRRSDEAPTLLALNRPAPYLDRAIQEISAATQKANQFEGANGIGGGFGGGFGGGSGAGPGGGFFAVPPEDSVKNSPEQSADENPFQPTPEENPAPSQAPDEESTDSVDTMEEGPLDPLSAQQQQAADNLGLGNVSTLQAYHGSRVVHAEGRNYNCMGDELICTSANSGEKLWSITLEGDLKAVGGHLAAPPVLAEGKLFLALQAGDVLQIDPQSGHVQTRYKIGCELRYPPVVSEGRLYVSSQTGKVECIRIAK